MMNTQDPDDLPEPRLRALPEIAAMLALIVVPAAALVIAALR